MPDRRITSVDVEADVNAVPARRVTAIDVESDVINIPQRRTTQVAIEADISTRIIKVSPETVGLVEATRRVSSFIRRISEVIGIVERSLARGIKYIRVVSEVESIVEAIKRGPIAIKKLVNEIIGVYENILGIKTFKRVISEIVGLLESTRRIHSRTFRDVVGIYETRFFFKSVLLVKIIREVNKLIESFSSLFSNPQYSFDDGLLPNGFYTYNWTVTTSGTPHSGTHHLKSGSTTINKSSALTFSALTTSISFWWKSSTNASNYGEFYIDGINYSEISGTTSYSLVQINGLTNTVHVFEWRHAKTTATVTGDDAIYVDDVRISGSTQAKATNSIYGFELAALTDFTTSGSTPWAINTSNTYQGTYSVKAGAVAANESSSLHLSKRTVELGFWSYGSSELTNDPLQFKINGGIKYSGSGSGKYNREGWAFIFYYNLPVGENIFEWKYTKNDLTDSGSDSFWVDNIEYKNFNNTLIVGEVVRIYETIVRKGGKLAKIISEVIGVIETAVRKGGLLSKIINEIIAIVENRQRNLQLIRNRLEIIGIVERIISGKSALLLRRIAEVIAVSEASQRYLSSLTKKIINEILGIVENSQRNLLVNFIRRIFAWVS